MQIARVGALGGCRHGLGLYLHPSRLNPNLRDVAIFKVRQIPRRELLHNTGREEPLVRAPVSRSHILSVPGQFGPSSFDYGETRKAHG